MTETKDLLNPFLDQDSELSTEERLNLFIQLCNPEELLNNFRKQAMLQQIEMASPDVVYSFAYSVLRIARPELFNERGEPNDD